MTNNFDVFHTGDKLILSPVSTWIVKTIWGTYHYITFDSKRRVFSGEYWVYIACVGDSTYDKTKT